ncbi:MAG TPA: PDZ domain-containing protein [Alphaproteobacteria bacterium]|nr:PDZ domain-containing protein [Alphaproteobacteria bacterium]
MGEFLSDLSQALAGTVAAAGQGVVRVEGRRRLPASGIVWPAGGVVVTAHHVVRRDEGIRLGLADGGTVHASVVGRDPTTDLAVLRAEAGDLPAAAVGGDGDLAVGHVVLALGRPGRSVQATMGIVSALGEEWQTPAGGRVERYVQTDVVMYPGFSGGPLVDAAGRVCGLNTSALLRGVSVALPAATVERVVGELLAHGRMRRGYLGVGAQPVRLPAGLADTLGQETGLLLASVSPGSPADEAGLMLGDVLVAFDGQPVRHMDELLALLGDERVGRTVTARIVRGGQLHELSVTVGERT